MPRSSKRGSTGKKFIAKALHPSRKGQFTRYCGGKVTQECINKGMSSPNEKVRAQAKFAEAMRSIARKHRRH